jgi:HAD superfamily hydrolase (TIGR01509 family)
MSMAKRDGAPRVYHGGYLLRAVRGAVLDFDGVIARSMELHAEAYRRVLGPYGAAPTDREVFLLEGARSETLIREILERHGRRLPEAEIGRLAEAKQRIFADLGPAPLYPGAEALVARVRAAVDRLGLVTGTRKENLERFIPGLLPRFDALLAQDAYGRDKPDPEPYERAAAALRLEPRDCAALENAVRGVASARRAKYAFIVGITTTLPGSELKEAGATAVAASHEEAAALIQSWARSSGRRAR